MTSERSSLVANMKGKQMSSDIKEIEAIFQDYFDGLYERDISKLEKIFDKSCMWYVREGDAVSATTVAERLAGIASRPSPQSLGLERHDRIVTIEIAEPELAFVRLNLQIPPRYFTDYMTLVKLPGAGWKIVSKTFYAETRE